MPRSPLRFAISSLAFGLASVVNPAYLSGCASATDDGPSKSELREIEADLVEDLDEVNGIGAWTFTHGGEDYEVLLALSQEAGADEAASAPGARFTSTAYACGTHTFFQSASACATNYDLAVEGTLTLRRLGANAATIVADLAVTGTLRSYGGLFLQLGDEGYLSLGEDSALDSFEAQSLGEEQLDFSFSRY
jgi:hypothetical protein